MPDPAPTIFDALVLRAMPRADLLELTLEFDPGGNPRLLQLPPGGAVTVDGTVADKEALLAYLGLAGDCVVTLFPAEKPFGLFDRAEFLTVRGRDADRDREATTR